MIGFFQQNRAWASLHFRLKKGKSRPALCLCLELLLILKEMLILLDAERAIFRLLTEMTDFEVALDLTIFGFTEFSSSTHRVTFERFQVLSECLELVAEWFVFQGLLVQIFLRNT